MQIDRLRLLNFRQHADTELVLGAGLTGIVGPNGAGKTTLLEAIAWAMYGAPAARGTRDSIRRRGAGSRAPVRVELDFTLGPHRYRVVRSLNSAELFQDADSAPIANSLATVTERLERLLGMSQQEFFNTYFTGQKELAVMAAMRPTERAQFLSRVLGYERLRFAQDQLKEARTALRARLSALESGLPDPAELDAEEQAIAARMDAARTTEQGCAQSLAEADRRVAEITPRWEAMQRLQETVQAVEGDLRLAEHKVQSVRDRFQELDRRLIEANEAHNRLEMLRPQLASLDALRQERQTLDVQAESFAARQATLAQLLEVRSRLVSVEERLARLPAPEAVDLARQSSQALRDALSETTDRLDERRTAWVRDTQDARTKRDSLREQYQELKQQHERILEAGKEGACPTCARPLGEEYDNVLGVLERQLQDVMFNGQFYKQRIDQLANEPQDLHDLQAERARLEQAANEAASGFGSLQALAKEGPTLREERAQLLTRAAELEILASRSDGLYDQTRHREVRRLLAELEPLALSAERLRAAAERGQSLVKDAEAVEKEMSEREAAARSLRDRLTSFGYSEEGVGPLRDEFTAAERSRREHELGLHRARVDVQAVQESAHALTRRRQERERRQAEVKRTQTDLTLNLELDRALADLRTDLNAQLRPDLSELASSFIRDLTNGRYTELELDEDYVAVLLADGEPKPVISGGEEDVANLALRLAISQMIAERAGQPLSLLVLDEIFGSLDEERRLAVLDLLRSLADRFPQVILITHIESVREGFDRIVRVDFNPESGSASVRDEPMGGIDGLAA
jgi:exonuclease SbcC